MVDFQQTCYLIAGNFCHFIVLNVPIISGCTCLKWFDIEGEILNWHSLHFKRAIPGLLFTSYRLFKQQQWWTIICTNLAD